MKIAPILFFIMLLSIGILGCHQMAGDNLVARRMVNRVKQQIGRGVSAGASQAQVISFVESQKWSYSGFEAAKSGSTFRVEVDGVPSGVVYCDSTGRLPIIFHFDHEGKLVSYVVEGPVFGCI
jgi:hypothetical protein